MERREGREKGGKERASERERERCRKRQISEKERQVKETKKKSVNRQGPVFLKME